MKEIISSFLKENGIPFEKVGHNPVFTMEDMEKEGLDKRCTLCKNLFLRDAKGKRHFLITAFNETHIDLNLLGQELGTKLSFASEKRIKKYLGSCSGCVSPLGIIFDESAEVEIILDEKLKNKNRIGLHPNENTSTFIISETGLVKYIKSSGHSFSYKKFR